MFTEAKLFHKAGEGSGGGDEHNLGWYATESALTTAHPTAEAGDWAIVGATDTVWIWDTDTTAWVDSDQKGQVTSVNNKTGAVTITGADVLPSQTGNSGKFLTTNGTNASWGNALVNTATGTSSLTVGGTPTNSFGAVNVGSYSEANNVGGVAVGCNAKIYRFAGVAVGSNAVSTADYAVQIGGDNQINTDANTFKVGNNNGNFEMMSADGTIPADRLVHAINKYSSMPTAASTNEGWIVQFTGTTDSTYTHGHLYECVSDGGNPATYSWTEVSMGGGSSLPSQTGNSGKFLTTDGTDASWGDRPVIKGSNRLNYGDMPILWAAGYGDSLNVLQLGAGSGSSPTYGVTLGAGQNNVLDIKGWGTTYADGLLGTIKVNNVFAKGTTPCLGTSTAHWDTLYVDKINNGNAITVPTTGGTMVVVDYTGATSGQVLTYNGTNAVWAAPGGGGGSTSTTALLDEMGWSGNSQTVNVTGVTASNNVIVAAAPASQADYSTCGIICTAQGAGTLTFTCDSVPTTGITVNVLII